MNQFKFSILALNCCLIKTLQVSYSSNLIRFAKIEFLANRSFWVVFEKISRIQK